MVLAIIKRIVTRVAKSRWLGMVKCRVKLRGIFRDFLTALFFEFLTEFIYLRVILVSLSTLCNKRALENYFGEFKVKF